MAMNDKLPWNNFVSSAYPIERSSSVILTHTKNTIAYISAEKINQKTCIMVKLSYHLFLWMSMIFLSHSISAQNIHQVTVPGPEHLLVNTLTGNLFNSRSDLEITDIGFTFNLTFYFNSLQISRNYGYGRGWTHNYHMRYENDSSDVVIEREDSRRDLFTYNGSGYDPGIGMYDKLEEYTAGKFRLTTKNGKQFFFDNATHKRLTSIVDRNGNTTTLNYTDSLLSVISLPSGRNIVFTYTNGLLTQVEDANVTPSRIVTYTYDQSLNVLTSVTDALGNQTDYDYDNRQLLSQLTSKLNLPVNIGYGSCGVSSISSTLSDMGIVYDTTNKVTTVTENVGGAPQVTTYTYDAQDRLTEREGGGCCGYSQSYQYDANNQISLYTDGNGNTTSYTYDAKGNLLTETGPFGFSNTYTWDTTFNLIKTSTDKNGNFTEYFYDANGNVTQIDLPDGNSIHFQYDSFGNPTTFTDGNGNDFIYTYDANGNMTSYTDPEGGVNTLVPDGTGNITSYTNPNNKTWTYTYDASRRLTKVTDPTSLFQSYEYDANGNLSKIVDESGQETLRTYDERNRLTQITTPLGAITTHTYDENNNLTSTTDPTGNTTQFEYDDNNRLIQKIDPLGHTTSYTYDANGNRISETDPNGNTSLFTYDMLDRLLTITDPEGGTTTFTYDNMLNVLTETDANGNTTTFTYDVNDQLTTITDALGNLTTFQYDGNGNLRFETDPNGNTTEHVYNKINRKTSSIDDAGNPATYTYDAVGNLLTITDRNNNTTTYTYNDLNERITETNAAGETTTHTYDIVGNLKTTAFPNGNIQTYAYDNDLRLTSITDLLGLQEERTYDANSRLLSQKDGNNNVISYTYDDAGRITAETDASGNALTYIYDNNGNIIRATDRNGNKVQNRWDKLNRKVVETDALGQTIAFEYDAVGNLTKRTDENGNQTSYTYDAINRLTQEIYPDNSSRSFTYDPAGNILSRTSPNGDVTSYMYDDLNRLTSVDYPGNDDYSYTYDAAGRMLTAVKNLANLSFTYDSANRLLSENLNGKTTSYTYDIPNRKKTITYPGGRIIEHTMNHRDQLTGIEENTNLIASLNYDLGNRLSDFIYGNGTSANLTFNSNDWITFIDHRIGINSFAHTQSTYDKEGNKTREVNLTHPLRSETYTYDDNYKLLSLSRGALSGGTIPNPQFENKFIYDGTGNRAVAQNDNQFTTYQTNTLSQYTSIASTSTVTPVYDNNGNLSSNGTDTYAYDFEQRLTAFSGSTNTTYFYDALGRRIGKIINGDMTRYYYDGQRIIEERDASDVVQATYVYGIHDDDVLSMDRGGSRYYYHKNSLSSTIALTNDVGTVVERYQYDAYGQPHFFDGSFTSISSSGVDNPYLFSGRRWDSESGLYHYRARSYDPQSGRFLQRDPAGYVDSSNLYEYVSSNPIVFSDPYGARRTRVSWRATGRTVWEGYGRNYQKRSWIYRYQDYHKRKMLLEEIVSKDQRNNRMD